MAGDYRKHSPLLPIVYNLSVNTGHLAPMHPSKSLSPSSPSLGPPHRCISLHPCIESPTGSLSLPHLPKLLQEEEKNNNNNKGKSIPAKAGAVLPRGSLLPSKHSDSRTAAGKQCLSVCTPGLLSVFMGKGSRETLFSQILCFKIPLIMADLFF